MKTVKTMGFVVLFSGLGCALAAPPARAADPDPGVVEEILQVLTERGLIDEGDHDRLVARYRQQEEHHSWIDRIRFSGDLRLRGEGFWYKEDALGMDDATRYRARYRLRFGADADINDWMTAHFRLASGDGDIRSTNMTLGRVHPDFDPDPIWIDRASLEVAAPEGFLPAGATASLDMGKIGNPFLWKQAKDSLLWDNDINPEGFALRLNDEVAPGVSVFANAGFFILQEIGSSSRDPQLLGAQIGGSWDATPTVSAGARVSYYGFRDLNDAFYLRGIDGTGGSTPAAGNLQGGLSDGDQINVGEIGAWLSWRGCEDWPLTLFGYVAQNFSAQSSPVFGGGEQDLAWSAGLEVGDKKRWAALGLGYWYVEADAFPSQFIDSDILDGETNRKGFAFWSTRRILPQTDLALTLFWSNAIEDSLPEFADSVGGAKRLRLQTDLIVSF